MKKATAHNSSGSCYFIAGFHGRQLIETDQIVRLQGDRNYTWLYLATGEKHLLSITLKRAEALLPCFLRISKGHLINPLYIVQYHDSVPPSGRKISARWANKGRLLLLSGDRLPWSRRRFSNYLEAYSN